MRINTFGAIRKVTLAAAFATFATTGFAGEGLSGVKVLTFNTFTGGLTDGIETDVGAFGMVNNVFSTVGDGVELPGFLTLYDVDFGDDSIRFNWVESEFSMQVGGSTPDGNHDRNYFVFDLPEGKVIKEVTFDAANSQLLEGSAEPSAKIISQNKIVTDFAAGVIREVGFAPVFNIVIGEAE